MIEFWTPVSLLLGAVVGSFLNVVILRLPVPGESIVRPASRCPSCNKKIRWYDNIPILSFILLKRRCRFCGQKISWQYPAVELTMALLSAALYNKFSLTPAYGVYFVFTAALLAIIFIDFRHQIIPDKISLPGIILGLVFSFFNPYISPKNSLIGLLAGGGTLYAVAALYYLIARREGMGGGDIKLLAMIGSFLGWQSLPFVVFCSSLLGTVAGVGAMVKQKKGGKTVIPYGPFLSVASIMYLFFQEKIYDYLNIYLNP